MNPSNIPDGQKLAENTPPDSQPTPNGLDNLTIPRIELLPYVPKKKKKKSSLLKIVIIILAVILSLLLIIVLIVIINIFMWSSSHGSERNKLEKETTSLFQNSNLVTKGYDCHDVELRNQCYFTISAPSSNVASYLQQRGFSKDGSYGYRKGELYIYSGGGTDGLYSSWHMSHQ